MTKKKRVLSGMQPSGLLHLGNLMGALDNWRRLQHEYECYYFIADWHALTTQYADTSKMRTYVHEMVLDWLAAGLDPEKAVLFQQSQLPEHAVLHVLFSMITPLPWLERVPTYKEKLEQVEDRDLYTYGFLGYPVLQQRTS
jgi:tryptophanyl-tRNA synthetase